MPCRLAPMGFFADRKWVSQPELETHFVSWPAEGIAESSCDLDATELRQRATESAKIWPS